MAFIRLIYLECVIIEKMKASDKNLRPFFWEADLSKINIEGNKQSIIERILEFGDRDAVQWLFSKFSLGEIKTTLEISKRISKKSKNFWLIFLEDQPDV